MTKDFDFTVTVPNTNFNYVNTTSSTASLGSLSTGTTTWGLGSTSNNWHYHYSGYCAICHPYSNIWSHWVYSATPEKVYMYQISCPKCDTKTFGELDTVIKCKKCKSTIKLVSKVTDYEVAVDL